MTFHEDYWAYKNAGINSLAHKLELSRKGIEPDESFGYAVGGYRDKKEMLFLKENGVNGDTVKEQSDLGLRVDAETFLKLKKEFHRDEWGFDTRSLGQYCEAGFGEDPETILELHAKTGWGNHPRLDSELALFFAEHGLRGDKKAMLAIPRGISYDSFRRTACKIALRLNGEDPSPYLVGDRKDFDKAEIIRKQKAHLMPIDRLVILNSYDLGNVQGRADGVSEALKDIRETNKLRDRSSIERAEKHLQELTRRNDTFDNNRLMEAYCLLVNEGEAVFKSRYKPGIGWINDGEGGLRFSLKAMDDQFARMNAEEEV